LLTVSFSVQIFSAVNSFAPLSSDKAVNGFSIWAFDHAESGRVILNAERLLLKEEPPEKPSVSIFSRTVFLSSPNDIYSLRMVSIFHFDPEEFVRRRNIPCRSRSCCRSSLNLPFRVFPVES